MNYAAILLEYVRILAWPVTALIALRFIGPLVRSQLAGSKIKVVLFGVEVETTLSELESATTEYLGRRLTEDQLAFLHSLYEEGEKQLNPTGVSSKDQSNVRPLRNAGLIMTLPTGAYLAEAKSLRLTALGDFLIRNKVRESSKRSDDRPSEHANGV
jgi:hypothetical protein